jgi:glycosyltransferase involved in cell wall biosynthesis
VRLLGRVADVATLLAAADVLVSPSRYESYGLAVHEALCRGLPAIASARAGVAERYPAALRHLLLRDPEDVAELADRVRLVRARPGPIGAETVRFGETIRSFTWSDMAAGVVRLIENGGEAT